MQLTDSEKKLMDKYCSLVRHYVEVNHYYMARDEQSETGSWYFTIQKCGGDSPYTKVRISNHKGKSDDLELQFRVDLVSKKRPPKNLKEKVFKSLDDAMKRSSIRCCSARIEKL